MGETDKIKGIYVQFVVLAITGCQIKSTLSHCCTVRGFASFSEILSLCRELYCVYQNHAASVYVFFLVSPISVYKIDSKYLWMLYIARGMWTCTHYLLYSIKWMSLTNSFSVVLTKIQFESRHEKTCFLPYANNKGADQPAHPRRLICAFVVRFLDNIILLVSVSKISSL